MLRLSGQLGRAGPGTVDDREALASDEHVLGELPAGASALAREVCPVRLLPEGQRAVTFSLCGRKLRCDILEWHDFHRLGFDDAQRPPRPVGDDAQITGLRKTLSFRFVGPHRSSGCALRAAQHKGRKLVGEFLTIAEDAGFVEAAFIRAAGVLGEVAPERREM